MHLQYVPHLWLQNYQVPSNLAMSWQENVCSQESNKQDYQTESHEWHLAKLSVITSLTTCSNCCCASIGIGGFTVQQTLMLVAMPLSCCQTNLSFSNFEMHRDTRDPSMIVYSLVSIECLSCHTSWLPWVHLSIVGGSHHPHIWMRAPQSDPMNHNLISNTSLAQLLIATSSITCNSRK